MNKHNLNEIVNFAEKNNNFSDFNIVNNFKLNFTKYKSINSKKQSDIKKCILSGGSLNDQQTKELEELQQLQQNGSINSDQLLMLQQLQQMQQQNQLQTSAQLETTTLDSSIPPPQNIQYQPVSRMSGIQMEPDKYLPKPNYITDEFKTFTIEKGTILFYSTTEHRGFNTESLQLNGTNTINNSMENISFFTPNFRLASDKIQGCSLDKQKGYIHTFKVIRDIADIFIKLPYDTNEDTTIQDIHREFCEGTRKYSGVGFFYPKNEIELFNNQVLQNNMLNDANNMYYSEFYLCNPRPYLEYMYSQKCMSLRKLTDPYRFN